MNSFPTVAEYAKNAVHVEKNLSDAADHINQARMALESASSKVFYQEIGILDRMFKELYKVDLLLCNMETRTVKIQENKRP